MQQLISTCTFPFLNLSFHYDVVYQIVQSCICKEYSKNMQFMATSPYYNPTTYTSSESLRNIQFTTVSRHTIIMKTSTIYHKISSGLAQTLVLTKIMAREMAMFLTWEVVKAWLISRTIKYNPDSYYKCCHMTSLF